MKQKKPPYVLVGMIVVCICAVVFIGMRFAKGEGDLDRSQQPPPPDKQIGSSRPTESPQSISNEYKTKEESPKAKEMRDQLPPSILIPKTANAKPRYDPSSTSSLGPTR